MTTACLNLVRGFTAVTVLFCGTHAIAQQVDRVEVRNKTRGSRTTLYGRIDDYSNGMLTLRMLNSGTKKVIPLGDVINVETPLVEPHIKGLKAFRENRLDDARRFLATAIQEETRRWVHQDILALRVQVESRAGDHTAAMAQFAKLIRLDPKTRHFHLIPLVWHNRVTNGREQSAARTLLTETEPANRLMGASLLLSDPKNSWSGQSELESLAGSGRPHLVHFARAQLWRLELAKAAPGDALILDMNLRIRSMPDATRAGPYYLLGQTHLRRHEYDKAALAFLRLPLVHDTDHRLAGRACLEAAEALASAGRVVESRTLYREVATRFSDTPSARHANSALAE